MSNHWFRIRYPSWPVVIPYFHLRLQILEQVKMAFRDIDDNNSIDIEIHILIEIQLIYSYKNRNG